MMKVWNRMGRTKTELTLGSEEWQDIKYTAKQFGFLGVCYWGTLEGLKDRGSLKI